MPKLNIAWEDRFDWCFQLCKVVIALCSMAAFALLVIAAFHGIR